MAIILYTCARVCVGGGAIIALLETQRKNVMNYLAGRRGRMRASRGRRETRERQRRRRRGRQCNHIMVIELHVAARDTLEMTMIANHSNHILTLTDNSKCFLLSESEINNVFAAP